MEISETSVLFLVKYVLFHTSSKTHAAVQCPLEFVPLEIQGQCWNRYTEGIKRGQKLRSSEHPSERTTTLDVTQSYDAENMVTKFQFL